MSKGQEEMLKTYFLELPQVNPLNSWLWRITGITVKLPRTGGGVRQAVRCGSGFTVSQVGKERKKM